MLITGTVAWWASSSSRSSEPVLRPISATWREETCAVSRTDSPRVSWSSFARSTIGWPPSSNTPASNETRVRVDGCSNSSATVRPSSAREPADASLRASARSSSDVSCAMESSVPSRKCRRGSVRSLGVRVLTWNLFHGRSRPSSGRSLTREFGEALAGWEWDVALLQEVPPWFPAPLAAAAGADHHRQLTARNWFLPLQQAISVRNPDILKSWGGGCDAILVRGTPILEHRARRLRRLPEGRWVHGVRLPDGWVVNVHSHNQPEALALADTQKAIAAAREWAAGAPLIFGGDINLKHPPEFPGLVRVAGNHVDHLFTDGRAAAGKAQVINRGVLSDHPPVAVTLA
jgi:endonuclease/exonuclease/phosphatase family metal-dependent hydrolase